MRIQKYTNEERQVIYRLIAHASEGRRDREELRTDLQAAQDMQIGAVVLISGDEVLEVSATDLPYMGNVSAGKSKLVQDIAEVAEATEKTENRLNGAVKAIQRAERNKQEVIEILNRTRNEDVEERLQEDQPMRCFAHEAWVAQLFLGKKEASNIYRLDMCNRCCSNCFMSERSLAFAERRESKV